MMASGRRDVEVETRPGKLSEELIHTSAPKKAVLCRVCELMVTFSPSSILR